MFTPDNHSALIARSLQQDGVPLADTPPEIERRQHRRFALFDRYVYLYFGREYRVRIRDASLSGMRIVDAPEGLYVGARVRIVTVLNRFGPLAATCQVIHLTEVAGFRYAGLAFTTDGPQEREALTLCLRATALHD